MKIYTSVSDGTVVPQGQPFTLDGIAYPFNWLDLASPDDLAAHGISEQDVPDPAPPAPPSAPPVSTVPQAVTPRQARLALLGAGLLDQVNTAINAAGGASLITWEYASVIERNDPLINMLGQALGLTSDGIDALFVTASTL
jgi:hypothetical protein